MKFTIGPIKDLFGYSRRERRASLILLVLISLVLFTRFLVPEKHIEITDLTDDFLYRSGVQGEDSSGSRGKKSLFDPNTATYNELINAGLNSRQARTLINYRNSGGSFREKDDLGKVYGITGEKVDSLRPFIRISGNKEVKIKPNDQVARSVQKRIDINKCDSAALESLPGIGPVLAARIIKFRNLLGGYYSVEQLKEVYGLPVETYNRISGMLGADTAFIERISINSADYRALSRIIYLSRYEVSSILKYRTLMDSIHTIKELVDNKLIPEDKADRIRHYIRFE